MVSPKKEAEQKQGNDWETLIATCRSEIEALQREVKEIGLMIEQSQVEVGRLTQRNTSSTMQIQQIQTQIENLPRADIRQAYENALDAQQRLFLTRSQLDKLQSDKNLLERYRTTLERVLKVLETIPPPGGSKRGLSAAAQTVEMMIQAQETERQRLARAMHDGPAQALTNLILQTDIAMRLFDRDPSKAREELESLKSAANSTFQKVRGFIFDLRPMMLDDLGLAPTLQRYVSSFQEQTGLDIRLTVTGIEQRLENYQEVMIFRAVQELLGNVSRHAQATQVKLQIDADSGEVRISIDDNGKGFEVKNLAEGSGRGLKVIRDRVEMLGGEMEIDSVVGQGTRVMFSIPARVSAKS